MTKGTLVNACPDKTTLTPGEYAKVDGVWYGCTPAGELLSFANVATEHADGTLSVRHDGKTKEVAPHDGITLDHGVWGEA